MHLNCPFLLLLTHFCFLIGFEVSSDLLSVKHLCFLVLMPFWKVIQLSQEKSPLELTLFPASVPNSSKPVNHFSQPPFNKESLRFHNFYQYDDQSNNNLPVELKLEDSPTLQLTQHNENWPLYWVEHLFLSPPEVPSCTRLMDFFCFTSKLYGWSQLTLSSSLPLQG